MPKTPIDVTDRVATILDSAVAYRKAGDFDRAIVRFGEAIALEPDRGDYNFWRAQVFLLKGDLDQALLDLSAAIDKTPDYKRAHFERGVVWFRKGDMPRVKEDFKNAPGHRIDAWELESKEPKLSGLERLYIEATSGQC
jgi:tetratricopeptide (TPR) repeat protein